jgi:hypothetical protein
MSTTKERLLSDFGEAFQELVAGYESNDVFPSDIMKAITENLAIRVGYRVCINVRIKCLRGYYGCLPEGAGMYIHNISTSIPDLTDCLVDYTPPANYPYITEVTIEAI